MSYAPKLDSHYVSYSEDNAVLTHLCTISVYYLNPSHVYFGRLLRQDNIALAH